MTFSNDKAIYIQMADRLCDDILAGVYTDDERIPSVREYAVKLEVNTNTAVKAYDYLARDGIIYNKRGLGYFVTAASWMPAARISWRTSCPTCSATCGSLMSALRMWSRNGNVMVKAYNMLFLSDK